MDYLEYKGYKGSVEYSREDNCLVGKVQDMDKDLIAYQGLTLDELRQEFEAGIDSYIEGCIGHDYQQLYQQCHPQQQTEQGGGNMNPPSRHKK